MIRRTGRHTLLGLVLGVAAMVSCRPPAPPFASLDRDLAPLREAFNADVGRTRVLILVAPT